MSKRNKIPLHSLGNNTSGIEVRQLTEVGEEERSFINHIHRDDHYIFLFHKKGHARMIIDFKEVEASGTGVFCILPGQVHYGISMTDTLAWFLAVDGALVQEQFRTIFEERSGLLKISSATAERLEACFSVLKGLCQEPDQLMVTRSMTDVVIGLFAGIFSAAEESRDDAHSRTTIITRQFKSLLKGSFREMKRPSAYAEALNISPSYLNEAVKLTTGLPVSHWIQEEVIMEAKRLLFYTDNTVKQIADDLGFEDHTYFSRVFNRAEGMPPLAFRKKYRK